MAEPTEAPVPSAAADPTGDDGQPKMSKNAIEKARKKAEKAAYYFTI